MRATEEMGFEITESDMQVIEMTLKKGEKVIADAGALMFMEQGICHEVISDGRRNRWRYYNDSDLSSKIAFSSPVPGKILVMDLSLYDHQIRCHGNTFLCSSKDANVSVTNEKTYELSGRAGSSLTIETISGKGCVFLKSSGPFIKKDIKQGEVLRADSRCLIAMTKDISYDYQLIGESTGMEHQQNGGEYIFISLSGPGTVWLQSAVVK